MKIRFTFVNGLRQSPKDFDFSVLPNLIFSRPPEDVKIIHRKYSFALSLEWGYWAVGVWFIFTRPKEICYQKCESCEDEFDIETMTTDSECNWFCPDCWEELVPIMKKEYQELVERGEIDPDEYRY